MPQGEADERRDAQATSPPREQDYETDEEERERRRKEASAAALTLEIVGDLPHAEIRPPENVLFVCKLNPVTRSEDLELIFSRFGKITSCEVIKDKKVRMSSHTQTGDSLQYAFIEFEDKASTEQAYEKMQNVLIDDRRIWVDFSQSVSRLHGAWVQQRTRRGARQGSAPQRAGSGREKSPPQTSRERDRYRDSSREYGRYDDRARERSRYERSRRHSRYEDPPRSSYDRESRHTHDRDSHRSRHDSHRSRHDSYRSRERTYDRDRHRPPRDAPSPRS